ncbi:MAG TPA: hypothetical protein VKQ72_18785 [Aggregatilineales bacterium]|nr:hypothetical protein [Aggregatilineales bacterium]
MTRTLYLIVENKNDADVVRAILLKKGYDVRVYAVPPAGGGKGISRLGTQLKALIETARKRMKPGDCLAVLHDFDGEERRKTPTLYKTIKGICKQSKVMELVAVDKIEAWLLADSGVLAWLNPKSRGKPKPKSWDEEPKVKAALERQYRKTYKTHYTDFTRAKIVEQIVGDADKRSPSLSAALQSLQQAGCM